MPSFIHTKRDEDRWERAKSAAGKSTKTDSNSYWALSNYIYHKMGKTEEDRKNAELAKQELFKTGFGGMLQLSDKPKAPSLSTSMPNPMKVGQQATVKMPKAKSAPDPFGKKSLFFKSEDFAGIKHPTIEKLRAFLEKVREES